MASTKRSDVQRGEVWLVALDPVVGSEKAKTRPCVILQRDAANRSGPTTVVVPFTTAAISTGLIAPQIPSGDGGLEKNSAALCHQIRVVDRIRLRARLGSVSEASLPAVCAGVRAVLDLECP